MLLLFLATGCLSLVFREVIEMPKIYICLEIDQILLMLLLIAISSWAAHPMLQSFAHAGSVPAAATTKRNGKADKRFKGKGELRGVFLFPFSWEVHSKSVADLGLE